MAKPVKRDVVSPEEKMLAIECTNSNQFYQRYQEQFPQKGKSLLAIGKIWARRSHFKKEAALQGVQPALSNPVAATLDGILAVVKEMQETQKEVLNEIKRFNQKKK
jgi:hypothetical protein